MYRFRLFAIAGLLCLHYLCCLGIEHPFSQLSIEDGLSNNHVNAIYKDSNGFIWIGTLDGIDRYDGVIIKNFSYRFSGSVETVTCILEDFSRILWVGTSTGLFRYNGETDRFDRVQIDLGNIAVNTLVSLPDSSLCVGTVNGTYLVDANSFQSEKLLLSDLPGFQNMNVTGIFPENHDICWMTTGRGLVRYSLPDRKGEFYQCELEPHAAYNSFSSICNIGDRLYLGTTGVGIVEFDISTKVFSEGPDIDNKIILNITSDNRELIYVGTDGGGLKVINSYTREVESNITMENDPESLSSNSVYSFFLDEDGRYWVGTYSAGFCFSKHIASKFKLHHITRDYPDVNKSIRSFYFSPDGSQYFGTRNGFAQLSENGAIKIFRSTTEDEIGLRSNIILSIYPFLDDILIGTYGGGLSRFSVADQELKPFLESGFLYQGNIYAFDTDNSGNLWITTFDGLYRYSPITRRIDHFTTRNCDLVNDQIFDITFDAQGRLWVGSMSGVSVYKHEGIKLESIDLSVIVDNTFKINYIYEDTPGNIWICTEKGGLVMLDPELTRSTLFRVADGLPDNSVSAIIERNPGEYWISTLKGLCQYSIDQDKFSKCYISDGLPGPVFTPAATYLAQDGTLFFGNEKGLVYCSSDDADDKPISSNMVITDFYVAGREVKPGENSVLEKPIEETMVIHLNDRMNNIGFRFVALNFINPAENHYQYKMEGLDNEWKDNGNNRTVFFENLNSGSYLFSVRSAIEDGIDSANSAEVRIIIRQLIFSSYWFFVFLLLLFLTGVFIMIRFKAKLPEVVRNAIGLDLKYEKYKGSRIDKSQGDKIISELKQYMEEGKPYLNAELKIADLADHVHYSTNEISQVLNQDLNQSFSDFVNKYRIREVKRLMKDKAFEKFTLVAIAEQSGFNSKTSFYRIFKNETGKTPADYLKELHTQDRPKNT